MTRITLAQLLLGVSLCFASASIAYDRHVIRAALAVGPANIRIDHQAGAGSPGRRTGVDLGFRVAWRTDVNPPSNADVAAALSIELGRTKWI